MISPMTRFRRWLERLVRRAVLVWKGVWGICPTKGCWNDSGHVGCCPACWNGTPPNAPRSATGGNQDGGDHE